MLTPEELHSILERIDNGTASAEDKDALRRSLQQSAETEQIALPSEPMTFNIGEVKGEDIQFGDRFTIENILGQKVIYISVDEIKTRKLNQNSPYKGLKKFEPEDKEFFFGRDQFITELANELGQTNLLLLLGASGSGKSSVVRAGLLSWLQKKWGSRLVNLTLTPDQDPFESLYGSLLRYYKQAEAQVAREGREDTLTQVVTGLRRSDSFWFIFIDQFEELFTTSQGEKRDRFIAGLVQLNTALKLLGSTKDCPVKIVATMRADFLDRFSPYPTLVKATDKHRPLIAEMRVDELRQAIEQPAAHHGVVFETGLVEEITKDVQGQAGYLPLLQYTLNLVWDTEKENGSIRDRTLNISTYRGLGGVRGALRKRVNHIYEALPETERLAAQRIFLKLVEIGGDEESGTEWKPVRRRALRSEFDNELEQRVLVKLIDENLLVSDRLSQAQESTVEIAHEALLTSWETLNTWIKENRQAIGLRNRLNDDVARWQAKKAEDELWTGSKLEQVLELKNNPMFNQVMGGFSLTANQFIDASLGLRDRIKKRQIRQARTIAAVSIGAVALVSVAGVVAMFQRQVAIQQEQEAIQQKELAERQSKIAYARQLIAQAEAAKNQGATQLQYSMLLAIEGVQRLNELGASSVEGEAILRYGLSIIPPLATTNSTENYTSLKAELETKLVEARPCPVGTNYTEDASDRSKCDSPNKNFRVRSNTYMGANPGQNTKDYLAFIDNTKTKQVFAVTSHIDSPFFSFAFSKDSRYLMIADGDENHRRIWDLSFGNGSARLVNDEYLINNGFTKAASLNKKKLDDKETISQDGKYLATTDDITSTLKIVENSTNKVVFQRSLENLAASLHLEVLKDEGTYDNSDLVAEFNNDKEVRKNTILSYLFRWGSKDFVYYNQEVYFASGDSAYSAWLWKLTENKVILLPLPRNYRLFGIVLSPLGKYTATRDNFNTIKIFSNTDLREIFSMQNNGSSTLAFSFDEKYFAVTSWENTVRLYEVSTGQEINRFEGAQSGGIGSIMFSPDGKYLATRKYIDTMNQYEVRLWSLQSQELIPDLCSRLTRNLRLDEWKQVFGELPHQKTCSNLPLPGDVQTDPSKVKGLSQPPNAPEIAPTPLVSQPSPKPTETLPSPEASPSPLITSYKFEFPQASCGDSSAKPGSAFPVFIDNKPLKEIRSKYCTDAYPVSKRQKTGKPSVQVASFTDRQKAEAFAKEVGGEVGEP